MKLHENLNETLSFYGVECNKPYYISSGNPILEFPKKLFRMDFYNFCICLSGNMVVEINNVQYNISKNDFIISAPNTIISFLESSSDFSMKLLFFEKNFLLKNISNPFFIERLSLFGNSTFSIVKAEQKATSHFLALLEYLQKQTDRKGKFIEDIIRSIMINLLLEVASIIEMKSLDKKEPLPDENNVFFKFNQLVQQNAASHKQVRFYADVLCVTNKHLIKIIKKASGKAPHQIIDEAVLKEAFVQLNNPNKTISQIAFDIGFNSTSTFGRFFKKHTSISPMEYRKQQLL